MTWRRRGYVGRKLEEGERIIIWKRGERCCGTRNDDREDSGEGERRRGKEVGEMGGREREREVLPAKEGVF